MVRAEKVSLCRRCWDRLHPGREPVHAIGAHRPKFCALCEGITRDGILVRMTTEKVRELKSDA